MADDQLRTIVQRMVDAGESESNIAAVIQHLSAEKPSPTDGTGRPIPADLQPIYESMPYIKKIEEGILGGGTMGGLKIVGKEGVGLGQRLARRIYSGLLKPKQAVKDSFGEGTEIAATALQERIPITKGGVTKVRGRLGESRQAALKTVADADAAGMRGVEPKQIISEFGDAVGELRKRIDIGQPSELARVGQRGRAITKTAGRGGGFIPLTRAQQLKETAQEASSGAYRALERGGQKQLSADDLLDTATARGLRKGIEARVPDVAPHNQRTQSLLGVTRALEDAVERESNTLGVGGAKDFLSMMAGGGAYAAGAGPMAIPLAVGTRVLTTPSTGSMTAILLNEASKRGVLDGATRAAILATLGTRANQQ